MDDLYIGGTSITPEINFKKNGKLEICGKSIPVNAHLYFEPIIDWIEKYEGEQTVFSLKIEYFNTSTSKVLYDMLSILNKKHNAGALTVKWYYEEGDEDVLETGQYFQSIMKIPFEFYVLSEYEMMEY